VSDADILRPADTSLAGRLQHAFFAHYPPLFAALRAAWPIPHAGKFFLVTRYDDVREVFLNDPAFMVPYAANLDLIMGHEAFFLGMADTPEYRQDTAALRAVVLDTDLPDLAAATAAEADRLLDAAPGRIETVDYTRTITFAVLCRYFGISLPSTGDLRVWATRLFEFQFTYTGPIGPTATDPLYQDAARMAPLLRAHVDSLIAAQRSAPDPTTILGRCLLRQQAGEPAYTDAKIRSALIGCLVGGLPQPPMVLPQALNQLLLRPDALAAATAADTPTIARHLFEALRFDPLAPLLQRTCTAPATIAAGTPRATHVPAGATVGVSFASAMQDPRRIANPATYDPNRPDCAYMNFGYSLHRCFGEHINRAILPVMLARLLHRSITRASPLTKRGIFAESLWVTF
jgi:cytochrome P450